MRTRTEIERSLDHLTKLLLYRAEGGRCFVCGKAAHDPAHIFGRSRRLIRWDVHATGNVHLLCRTCHEQDEAHPADSEYKAEFVKRFGVIRWFDLSVRSDRIMRFADHELEELEEKMQARLESPESAECG
jgi:hypothetical protein